MIRSIGLRSDLLTLRNLSMVEEYPDRVIVRTPSEPNFWYGNLLIFRADTTRAEDLVARFQADFPEMAHVTLAWDLPGMTCGPTQERLVALGFELDQSDVLTLREGINRTPPPSGINVRQIRSDEDWHNVIDLQAVTGLEDGHAPEAYLPYLRTRFANRRRQVQDGLGAWFGAFDGEQLVGDLGILVDRDVARYQDVETRASHRRRGICAALVTAAADWAAERVPQARLVIIAEQDGEAGRVYRRCGFTRAETLISAVRKPPGSMRPDS